MTGGDFAVKILCSHRTTACSSRDLPEARRCIGIVSSVRKGHGAGLGAVGSVESFRSPGPRNGYGSLLKLPSSRRPRRTLDPVQMGKAVPETPVRSTRLCLELVSQSELQLR